MIQRVSRFPIALAAGEAKSRDNIVENHGCLDKISRVPVSERIRDRQYGNDVKGLRNVAHRNHLEKLTSGRQSAERAVSSLHDCRRHHRPFH